MNELVTAGGIIALAGVGLGLFLRSYLGEKGKNLATKEDIGDITKKIEEVKAVLGSRLHIHRVRYEHEFKILLELTEKLVAVRDAATGLRPEVGYGDINDPDVKKARAASYIEAARELYIYVETRQPFFPDDLYLTMKAFDRATWKEFVQFKHQTPDDVAQYWDNALENGAVIGTLASAALVKIRERVCKWEAFDPGP
jgi:hypothetical protein